MFKVFDFQCLKCDNVFEELVKPDSKPPCPKCAGETKKLLSPPAMLKTPFTGGRQVTR